MMPPDGVGSATFTVTHLFLGDTNRDGTPNKVNGWKNYGFDRDGKASTLSSADLCKPRNNAQPKNVYPDGPDGLDNSFGKNILPIFFGIAADFSSKVNEDIAAGKIGLMFDLALLGPDADDNPLLGRFYLGAPLGQAPQFNGNDIWPITAESLLNPNNQASAKTTFPGSYLTANTWVGHASGDLRLALQGSALPIPLIITHAVVAMRLDPAHKLADEGVISGILDTDTFTNELKKAAGALDPSLCSGPTIDSIVAQMEQASDILKDGSQDPSKLCDGISIGLGFNASRVILGATAAPVPPPPDPCAP